MRQDADGWLRQGPERKISPVLVLEYQVRCALQQRQELAFSLYPEGLRYSPETHYFEPHNALLMNSLQDQAANFYRAELGQEASNAGPLPQTPIPAQTGDRAVVTCRILT
jgi:hypothetical protein